MPMGQPLWLPAVSKIQRMGTYQSLRWRGVEIGCGL